MARILVVDDQPSFRTAVVLRLTRAGHEATAAADGAEALRAIRSGGGAPPDLVLLDLSMPTADGFTAPLPPGAAGARPSVSTGSF